MLKCVRDVIPKQIGYFLVQQSQDKLQSSLWMRISQNQNILGLLGEPASITERRRNLNAVINTLNNSIRVIQRDPDISAAGMDDDELT